MGEKRAAPIKPEHRLALLYFESHSLDGNRFSFQCFRAFQCACAVIYSSPQRTVPR
jgi:hypothetical protein